jgi:hypothetical protein
VRTGVCSHERKRLDAQLDALDALDAARSAERPCDDVSAAPAPASKQQPA